MRTLMISADWWKSVDTINMQTSEPVVHQLRNVVCPALSSAHCISRYRLNFSGHIREESSRKLVHSVCSVMMSERVTNGY